jgi:hypothetical protein
MNREGAETFLRLLAEAQLRDQLAPDPPPWAGGPGAGRVKVSVVGQALTAVEAIDGETVEDILADFDLAVSLRQLHDQGPGPGRARAVRMKVPRALQYGRPGPPPAGPAQSAPSAGHDPDQKAADWFAPIGLALPFQADGLSGELYLMSFAHTGSGARLIVLWGKPTLSREHELGLQQADPLPVSLLTVTDDRGSAYELDVTYADGPDGVSQINLHPAPPDGTRWLEVAAPPGPAVRVNLHPADGPPSGEPEGGAPEISAADLSAGEQLLIMLADELLMTAAQFPLPVRPELPASWPPAVTSPRVAQFLGTGLGDIIAGLEAADALPPLSPIPARLAALCASLRIGGHQIAAAPADELPEPWLSLLTYYQRRKTGTAQVRDGFAAVTAGLPELDGIRLALVGLHNTQGATVLHVLARGVQRAQRLGPHGINLDFPLSFWLRDNGGRWHAGHPVSWHPADPEHSIALLLVPPLPRSTAWVEVLAGGRSGQVRARLPLRWGSPP